MFDESWLRQNAHRVIGGTPAPDPAPHSALACPTEEEEHRAVVAWADVHPLPEGGGVIGDYLVHAANGEGRSRATGGVLKAMGVRSGFPDLFLFLPRGGRAGLAIEMKREQGGHVRESQRAWIDRLRRAGYAAVVCRGFEAARDTITRYLAGHDLDSLTL